MRVLLLLMYRFVRGIFIQHFFENMDYVIVVHSIFYQTINLFMLSW